MARTSVCRELQQRIFQYGLRTLVELSNHGRCRLNLAAPVVQFSQFRNHVAGNVVGHAPARIVRQPPTVGGPDQVMCDDDRIRHGIIPSVQFEAASGFASRKRLLKPQAAIIPRAANLPEPAR